MDAMVVEAPPVRIMRDVVALESANGCVNASYERRPVTSVPHESTPLFAFTSQAAAPSDEAMRLVEDAVVAVIIVVDANGMVLAMPSPRIVVVAMRPTAR